MRTGIICDQSVNHEGWKRERYYETHNKIVKPHFFSGACFSLFSFSFFLFTLRCCCFSFFFWYRLRGHEDKRRALTAAHAEELKKQAAEIASLRSGLDVAPMSGSHVAAAEEKTAEVRGH